MKKYLIFLFLLGILTACGGKKVEQEPTGVGLEEFPSWVIDPKVEGGIAASDCIPWSGNLSVDKAQVTAQARATLAKQLEVRVSALDKTYIERTDAAGKTVTGSSFSSVSKQLSDQHLRGSRLSKISKIPIDGVKNLCGMVTIDPKRTEEIFKEILESSNRPVSAQDKDILYQEFKAYKAQQDLDKALGQN